jgi:hypothetical protein
LRIEVVEGVLILLSHTSVIPLASQP